ncbi:Hypothetical protein AA314_04465 [Archangium gephyra]|uniref:Uncharacterized protein n=1 Tax=Archangium gephyra TaxID=48 RepID=A0AAC8Q8J0_9BACT|nr:Hypothetical protein AA314_04465 [Archangium gephyra]
MSGLGQGVWKSTRRRGTTPGPVRNRRTHTDCPCSALNELTLYVCSGSMTVLKVCCAGGLPTRRGSEAWKS